MSCGNYTTICGACNCNPCCCSSPCAPANTIYEGTCSDPGSLTSLKHLLGLDQQFCERRLIPSGSGGYLVARQTPNGWAIGFSTTPTVALEEFLAVQGVAFGQVLVQQSDNVMRAMNGPAVANLVLGTNAAGQAMWIPIPAATVPDPLTVADLNVTNVANFNDVNIAGTTTMTGAATGTLTNILGLNATNEVIKGTIATTTPQSVTFFEAPTSPSATTPNSGVTAGGLLTIGNEVSSSLAAGALIGVTNSQTLAVVQAGYYLIDYCAGVVSNANAAMTPSVQLLINGVIVNNGNSRAGPAGTPNRTALTCTGIDGRRMVAGTTIQLQMASGSGSNISVYEARIRFTRIGD